ncbi:type II-A CRISPR-associated protein Csn2 [Aerococcaceae bacterium DSM 111176]|nr:type II-A CRISPR-associated protein Csn2 [Aerococcaceae bacterium DSM 111176]
MINMNFRLLDQPLKINKATSFVIEDIEVFRRIIEKLYHYSDDDELKLYDNNFQKLKKNEIILISDILNFSLITSQVLKLIHEEIQDQLNENPQTKSNLDNLLIQLAGLVETELLEHILDLTYTPMTLIDLLKALKVTIDSNSESIYDKMFDIVQWYKYQPKTKILIFVNSLIYFSDEQLKNVFEFIELNQIDVLFLDALPRENINHYILDNDYFLCIENDII